MAAPKRFFLIGMPAAGKTYWAVKLADKYALQFIDLDTFIVEQAKASISALFATYGENGFRERETKYLSKAIKMSTENTIIACGSLATEEISNFCL